MNDSKPTIWNRLKSSVIIRGIFIVLSSQVIIWVMKEYGDMNLMKSLFQAFIIELWPMWVGMGVFLIYLAIREVVLIHKFLTKGLKFDEKLNELGVERRELMQHVSDSYKELARKINKVEKGLPHI